MQKGCNFAAKKLTKLTSS